MKIAQKENLFYLTNLKYSIKKVEKQKSSKTRGKIEDYLLDKNREREIKVRLQFQLRLQLYEK